MQLRAAVPRGGPSSGALSRREPLWPCRGELFGVAPVPPGQAHVAVEQASDSSRNFVL